MTSLGYRVVKPGPFVVGTVGATFPEVDRITFAQFGTPGDTHYAFFVWGRAGDMDPGSATTDAQIEIGLGVPGKFAPSPNHIARICNVNWGPLQQANQGHPFAFCVVIDGVAGHDFGGLTAWTLGDALAVYAHTKNNSDPTSIINSFKVTDLCYLVLNLDQLTRSGIRWMYAENNATVTLSTTNQLLTAPGTAAFPATGGVEYLCFGHVAVQVAKTGGGDAPRFRMGANTDGTTGTLVVAPGGGINRWGAPSLRQVAGGSVQNTKLYSMLFTPIVPPSNGTPRLVLTGQEQTAGGTVGVVHSSRVFAVEVTKFAYYRKRVYSSYPDPALIPPFPTGITAPLVGGPGSVEFNYFQPFEINVPAGANYTTLHQGIVDYPVPQQRDYTPWCLAEGTFRVVHQPGLYCQAQHPDQGVPCVVMIPELIGGTPYKVGESRYQFYWWKSDIALNGEHYPIADLVDVGFFLDDNPANVVSPPAALPAVVQLVPGKEALGLGSLQSLPIKPGHERSLTDESYVAELISTTGYRRTWPKFATVRTLWRFTWAGLTIAERDSLQAFFELNPTFKWRLPRTSVDTAFAIMTRPEATDLGVVHTMTLDVGQLVNIGP